MHCGKTIVKREAMSEKTRYADISASGGRSLTATHWRIGESIETEPVKENVPNLWYLAANSTNVEASADSSFIVRKKNATICTIEQRRLT
jgi:hypothetical protein